MGVPPDGYRDALFEVLDRSDAFALTVVDEHHRYVWMSSAAIERQGVDPAAIPGITVDEVVGAGLASRELLDSYDAGRTSAFTAHVRLGDGRTRLAVMFPMDVDGRRVTGSLGVRLPSETLRRLSGQRLRESLLTDAAQLGVWEWDRTTDRVVWNPWHERLFGYEPGTPDRTFADWADRVHPDDRQRVEAQLARAAGDGRLFESSYRVIMPSGEVRHLEGRGQLDPDDPSLMVGVVYDVTERERAAEREAELQRQALTASDVERDRIAADIHDGPLQALSAAWLRLTTLAGQAARQEGGAEIAAVAHDVAALLGRTNEELRDVLGKLRSLPVDSSVDTFVHHVTDLGEELAERAGLQLSVAVETGDRHELPGAVLATCYRIVAEAMLNAANHAGAANLEVVVLVSGDRLVASVADDGAGFDTAAPPPSGHFGLSIMRQRARALHGTATIRSAPGAGTTVTVSLPLGAPADPSAQPQPDMQLDASLDTQPGDRGD